MTSHITDLPAEEARPLNASEIDLVAGAGLVNIAIGVGISTGIATAISFGGRSLATITSLLGVGAAA
jgi:hypothetical protein